MFEVIKNMSEAEITLAMALVGAIGWLFRNEFVGRQNSKDVSRVEKTSNNEIKRIEARIDALELKHSELDGKVMNELLEIKSILGNIQGQLINRK
jgi:hypothetical protein